MTVNGIIAEYNPFHNGHKYHLEESRCLTGADYTVVVMSGDFVQRGAPALADKHARARMALLGGADLVLELPALYASASSEFFAAGAVALLDKLGAVTHLCFGSECGDAALLRQIAAFLAEETESYRAELKRLLKQGLSYPAARAEALAARSAQGEDSGCGKESGRHSSRLPRPEECRRILSSPNNILGIDYMKELIRRKSGILPVTVQRTGAGYHDPLASENPEAVPASAFPDSAQIPAPDIPPRASALAIRQALREGRTPDSLRSFMPVETVDLLTECLTRGVSPDPWAFSGILYYKLLLERDAGYESYLDVSGDLSNRIRNSLNAFTGFDSFCSFLKTKEITHTRVSRCLLHILLDIRKEDMQLGRALDYTPYARVLGFRKTAEPLLGAIKAHCSIPLITRMADAKKSLPEEADRLLQLDILAGQVYRGIVCGKASQPIPGEFSIPVIVL